MRPIPLSFIFLLLTLTVSAFSQLATPAPQLMNFQGRLTRPDGTPVSDGNYSVRFSLWSAASGGSERWNRTINPVTVRNGTFAVLLDFAGGFVAGHNINSTFNGNTFLEIQIGADPPLTPRQQIASVAYALRANTVPDGSIRSTQL